MGRAVDIRDRLDAIEVKIGVIAILEVSAARQAFPEDPARQAAQLSSVGGTSWWWLLAGVGLSVAVGVLEGRLTSTLVGWLF